MRSTKNPKDSHEQQSDEQSPKQLKKEKKSNLKTSRANTPSSSYPEYTKINTVHHKPPHLGTFNVNMDIPQRHHNHVPDTSIDKFTFAMVLVILLSICVPLVLYKEQGKLWVQAAHAFVTTNFGFAYLAFGAAAFMFVIYVVFSDIGKIKLGRPEETAEFSDAS